MLEEKKKELTEKYDDDKMMREELYRKSVKSPTTQMYIDIEGKFLKYFRQPWFCDFENSILFFLFLTFPFIFFY